MTINSVYSSNTRPCDGPVVRAGPGQPDRKISMGQEGPGGELWNCDGPGRDFWKYDENNTSAHKRVPLIDSARQHVGQPVARPIKSTGRPMEMAGRPV